MLPKIPRPVSTFAALTVSVLLAVTGVANNLVGFFSLVAASFGPICGAKEADYLTSGRRWSAQLDQLGRLSRGWGFWLASSTHSRITAVWVKADNPLGCIHLSWDSLFTSSGQSRLAVSGCGRRHGNNNVQPLQSIESHDRTLVTSVDDYMPVYLFRLTPFCKRLCQQRSRASSISVAPNEGKPSPVGSLCGARNILKPNTGRYSDLARPRNGPGAR
jgi:hypothetical protein